MFFYNMSRSRRTEKYMYFLIKLNICNDLIEPFSMQNTVVSYCKAIRLLSLALVFMLACTTASSVKALFLSQFSQPTSQPYIYKDYPQIHHNQTQQSSTSCRPSILLDYSLTKIIRVLLPRLPTIWV